MDRTNYSNCPLKKRPIYFIKNEEQDEDDLSDGPIDLTVQKWKTRTDVHRPPQLPINYSIGTKEEESYNDLRHYDRQHQQQQNFIVHQQQQQQTNYSQHQYESFINDKDNGDDINNRNLYYENVSNQRNFHNMNFIKFESNDFDYDNSKIIIRHSRQHVAIANNNNLNFQPKDLTVHHNNSSFINQMICNDDDDVVDNGDDDLHNQMKNDSYAYEKDVKIINNNNNNDLYFQCATCRKCYSTQAGLLKHQMCHVRGGGGGVTDDLITTTCDEQISSTEIPLDNRRLPLSVANNRQQKFTNEVQRYHCNDCGKSYSTISGLTKHQQFHCPNSKQNQIKKTFNCKNCDKVYVSLGALKMHIRTHTLPCKCPLCGKAFSRPWLLQGHIRTHTGEKPFSCQHCNRAFADRSNLRAHLQTHSEVKKYSCSTCTKTFSRMSLLGKHLQSGCSGQKSDSGGEYQQPENNENLYELSKRTPVIVENNYYDVNSNCTGTDYDHEIETYA